MASNPELVNLNEDDKKHLIPREHKKWSVQVFGMDIPIWVIVVVIVIIVYVLHKTGYLVTIENKAVEFSEGTRRMLDRASKRTLSASPVSPMATALNVNNPSANAVRQQLKQLFNSF